MAKNRIKRVTDADIRAQFTDTGVNTDVDQTIAERSGSPDKVGAVTAEGEKPRVKTFTPEGRAWIEKDPYGLKTEGLYGKKGQTALQPEDLQRHAQFLGHPLGVEDLERIHSLDASAPESVICPTCGEPVTSFVRTVLIDRTTGDFVKDRNTGEVIYRGQFVAAGPDVMDLKVHGAHPGKCLFMLRIRRDRDGKAIEMRQDENHRGSTPRWVMLDAQSFEQATTRVSEVRESRLRKRAERDAERAETDARLKNALGFKTRGPRTAEDGIDRGASTPSIPRGTSRRQRRWVDEDATA